MARKVTTPAAHFARPAVFGQGDTGTCQECQAAIVLVTQSGNWSRPDGTPVAAPRIWRHATDAR